MMIVLPRNIEGLAEIGEVAHWREGGEVVERAFDNRGSYGDTKGLKMETRFSLSGTLPKMGMVDAFDAGKANFSGMDIGSGGN